MLIRLDARPVALLVEALPLADHLARIARRPAGELQRRIERELPALGAGQRKAVDSNRLI